MIAVIDYGMGNLRSVQKALEKVGGQAEITHSKKDIAKAEKIVLPGVGAMKPAMEKLKELGLIESIEREVSSGKPFLGICLGFQLLFESSNEGGDVSGLGLLKGSVKRFNGLKVPQIGWNQIKIKKADCPLYDAIDDNTYVYFCHSYYADCAQVDVISTTTEYGIDYTSSVWKENIFGVQFHPEKSQRVGLTILKNFTRL